MKPHDQKRPITAQDADGMTVQGVARRGRWRERCVKKENRRRTQRWEYKRRMRNHRDPSKNPDCNETIDKHEERPNGALRKAAEEMGEPEPRNDAANDGWIEQGKS